MRVINHDPLSQFGAWVNINSEHFGNAHLEHLRHIIAPLLPQPMRNAIGLNRLETLEIKERLQKAMARWVTLINRNYIRTRVHSQTCIRCIGLITDFTQNLFGHFA